MQQPAASQPEYDKVNARRVNIDEKPELFGNSVTVSCVYAI